MRLALSDLGDDDFFDYCVIGTGPAGITCALHLASKDKRVALLEGGDRHISNWSQNIYQGEVVGDPYFPLDTTRLRYFGGTSNHWGGWCRPLESVDFEVKGEFVETGWPISKTQLDPYLGEASRILEIPELPADRPLPESGLRQINFVWSPPVRFAEKFEERLVSDPGIALVLNANVTALETNGGAVTGVQLMDSEGNGRRLRANQYILAAGGIENSRLLLWSNIQNNGRLIRNAQALGKYWMDHPHFTIGRAIVDGANNWPFSDKDRAFLAPTEQTISKEGILNCVLRMRRMKREDSEKLLADIACIAPKWGAWAFRRLGQKLICGVEVKAAWEQQPRAVNRIELAEDRDVLGIPRPRLYWRKNETDLRTAQVTARYLGEYLARSNAGRLRLEPWVLGDADFPSDDELAGHHHIGGTRMARSAKEGIVDENCRVFGQSNLYIAGSSVFPSCGYANPTLTIVQLALRLVDHLRAQT